MNASVTNRSFSILHNHLTSTHTHTHVHTFNSFNSENLLWSKGPIVVDMWGLSSQRGDRCLLRYTRDNGGDRDGRSKGEKELITTADSVAELDQTVSLFLGGDYMPGSTADSAVLQDDRRRSVPLNSTRYRLSRTTAQSSSGNLQSHNRSPSIGSKGSGRFDDSNSNPHDALDLVNKIPQKEELEWLTSRRLAPSILLLDQLCGLDKVISFHLFLASCDASIDCAVDGGLKTSAEREKRMLINTAQSRKLTPSVLKSVFEGIALNLPNADMRRLSLLKCLYVLSSQSKSKASISSQQADFGVIIVELTQKDDIFLSFKISKLTRGCGQLSALVKIVVKSFFLSLKVCGLRAVKVKNDLSLSSLARTASTFQRKMIDVCLSNARSLSVLNIRKSSAFGILMDELVYSKLSLGFQIARGGSVGVDRIEEHSDGGYSDVRADDALTTHLFAVSPRSPSGIEMEALLQCKYSNFNFNFNYQNMIQHGIE